MKYKNLPFLQWNLEFNIEMTHVKFFKILSSAFSFLPLMSQPNIKMCIHSFPQQYSLNTYCVQTQH